jgi:magnesium transporter
MQENKSGKFFVLLNNLELKEHNDFFIFRERNIDDIIKNESPKLEAYDDYYFGIVKLTDAAGKKIDEDSISFFLKENMIVVATEKPAAIIEGIKDDLLGSENHVNLSEDKILYIFFDRLTNSDFGAVELLEQQITELESAVIGGEVKDCIKEIIKYRKKLLNLKAYYEHLLDISEKIEENENGIIDESAITLFKTLTSRVERLSRDVINLRDYVTQVREAYQAQVDISLNNIMKIFTVITAIFLPLTLIAGWYGMNFKYMPELSWTFGYPFAIALSAAVLIVCLVLFKKTKFL